MFELAKAPRELRDTIYEAALVRDVIVVITTELPNCENVSRSTWQDTKHPMIAEPGVDSAGVHEENVTFSYKLQASEKDSPTLNLFYASRQTYAECWPIFYKHNMFDFSNAETTATAASMCLAFLNDRPQQALQLIGRMHLCFREPLHEQDSRLISGPKSPSQWGHLCTKLSGDLSLHQLILSVDGRFSSSGPSAASKRRVPKWAQKIRKITTLRKLEVDVTTKIDFEGAFDLINHLRARMLMNGSELKKLGHAEFLYTKKFVGSRAWVVVSNYALPEKYVAADGVLVQRTSGPTAILMMQLENLVERMAELR